MTSKITQYFLCFSRQNKQLLMLVCDVLVLIFSLWLAFTLRFNQVFIPTLPQSVLLIMAPLVAIPVFIRVGLYRSVIRYVGEHVLWSVIQGMTFSTLLWATLAFMSGVQGVPRAVPVIFWLLGIFFISSIRFGARWLIWQPLRSRFAGRQVLIYGAGDAGVQLATALRQGREFFPAGFLDDDPAMQGKDLYGLRVYSPQQLPTLITRFDIRDVIVTLPSVPYARRQEVITFLKQFSLQVRVLPALTDIANGRHLVDMLREVKIDDLLGREPVAPDPALLTHSISGKNVMVTGAGGSIGTELCRQIATLSPARLVLLEANEYALYEVERKLRPILPCPLIACLGSVNHHNLVNHLLTENSIETVYHSAAHKHVPLVDANTLEGIRNNTLGTLTLAKAALSYGVTTFVLISTDKAVRPTNIMGATKRWAELIIQDCARLAREKGTKQYFCAVRFGNVLGSSGSVIPLFKEQISQGGPVTVTDAEMTRYFMSIHEAVELVLQAGSLSKGGEIFLLDMGEPIKIMELARKMIRLAGHTLRDEQNPKGDIEIKITGKRSGEKLYEELLIASGHAESTPHPKIMKVNESDLMHTELTALLEQLQSSLNEYDVHTAREILMNIASGKVIAFPSKQSFQKKPGDINA